MSSFGLNNDAGQLFGYAQTRPSKEQSLSDIDQALKTMALSDLSLNIRSDVSSSIISEQAFANGEASEKMLIAGKTESSISIGMLSGSQLFIDEAKCIAYARVSITKSDLPYIIALSDFRDYQVKLADGQASLSDVLRLPDLLANLRKTGQTSDTSGQLASMQSQIERTQKDSKKLEVTLRLKEIRSADKTVAAIRKDAASIVTLADELSEFDASSPDIKAAGNEAREILAEIDKIYAKPIIAISWSSVAQETNATLLNLINGVNDKYWAPTHSDTQEKLVIKANDYKLQQALFVTITSDTSQKFGIDEAEIIINLNFIDTKNGSAVRTETLKTKAIGRPISNEIIADKIRKTLEGVL
ncbi:MAG: hypothetical protein EBT87_04785 [Alphaproteobacteria bacterium]|nr:hypothetical protein [Alphaproteobacteria bacterium]